ncbi:hypothetical protein DFJ73DRAFT_623891 [Zopfochytrium polystomum]|nr:hypothetical protein DFJ73DRAFT_623891 [Zopfochytrium polystomum]
MAAHLASDGLELAYAYSPVWFFGQSQNQPPCIPTWAFSGSPSSPDVFDAQHKTPSAGQCQYPNVGCGCRNPGVPIANPAPPFPIYYTFARCSDTEVRVAYNLFYEKDGAKFGLIETGHAYDWERIVVVHARSSDPNAAAAPWLPARALYSAHSGYHRYEWASIQNTLSTDQAEAGLAKTPNGVQNLDHPKAYVAWSKHAHFDDRNTGWNDVISQSTDNAFRSQDWWYFVPRQYYVKADRSTLAGQMLGSVDWGSADSNPPKVHDGLCQI